MNERLHDLYGIEWQSAMISEAIDDFYFDANNQWLKTIWFVTTALASAYINGAGI